MPGLTFLHVEEIVLLVCDCDWDRGRIVCEDWTGSDASRLRPLLEILQQQQRTQVALRQGDAAPLHFAGYLTRYQCLKVHEQLVRHTVEVMMDGPLYREDGTEIEGVHAFPGGFEKAGFSAAPEPGAAWGSLRL